MGALYTKVESFLEPVLQRGRTLWRRFWRLESEHKPQSSTEAVSIMSSEKKESILYYQVDSSKFLDPLLLGTQNVAETQAHASRCFEQGLHMYSHGRIREARAAFKQAVSLYRSIIQLGVSMAVTERLAVCTLWLAIAQRQSKDSKSACANYLRSILLFRQLMLFSLSTEKQEMYSSHIWQAISGFRKAQLHLSPTPNLLN